VAVNQATPRPLRDEQMRVRVRVFQRSWSDSFLASKTARRVKVLPG
jgi:hypothetical protein